MGDVSVGGVGSMLLLLLLLLLKYYPEEENVDVTFEMEIKKFSK